MNSLDRLMAGAAEVAMRAAVLYLETHQLKVNTEELCKCLRSWCRIKIPEALRDVERALEVPGMKKVAEMTFRATMIEAGIKAAKEAGVPASSQPIPGFTWKELL